MTNKNKKKALIITEILSIFPGTDPIIGLREKLNEEKIDCTYIDSFKDAMKSSKDFDFVIADRRTSDLYKNLNSVIKPIIGIRENNPELNILVICIDFAFDLHSAIVLSEIFRELNVMAILPQFAQYRKNVQLINAIHKIYDIPYIKDKEELYPYNFPLILKNIPLELLYLTRLDEFYMNFPTDDMYVKIELNNENEFNQYPLKATWLTERDALNQTLEEINQEGIDTYKFTNYRPPAFKISSKSKQQANTEKRPQYIISQQPQIDPDAFKRSRSAPLKSSEGVSVAKAARVFTQISNISKDIQATDYGTLRKNIQEKLRASSEIKEKIFLGYAKAQGKSGKKEIFEISGLFSFIRDNFDFNDKILDQCEQHISKQKESIDQFLTIKLSVN